MAKAKDPNKPKRVPTGDYEHGFAKIADKHKWKPGQGGGYRGGRKKKAEPTLYEELLKDAQMLVTLADGEKITTKAATIMKLKHMALKGGNMKAIDMLLKLIAAAEAAQPQAQPAAVAEEPLSELELKAINEALDMEKREEAARRELHRGFAKRNAN